MMGSCTRRLYLRPVRLNTGALEGRMGEPRRNIGRSIVYRPHLCLGAAF